LLARGEGHRLVWAVHRRGVILALAALVACVTPGSVMKKHPQLRYVWPWAALLITALAQAQTYPADCTVTPTPAGCIPPPEWTPRLYFSVPTRPADGGSVPRPGYIPPPLPGEIYLTVPLTWDLYQATVTYIAGVNPQTIYGTFNLIKGQMQPGDSWVAHFNKGPCFLMYRHSVPLPQQATVLQGLAHSGDGSEGGGATSINGTMAACATAGGDGTVTIEVH
ncbi:MAG TPA: hypothetical protein VF764_12540, partial [Steroidobacteraceae bacterium]